jgi:hypothetical protein
VAGKAGHDRFGVAIAAGNSSVDAGRWQETLEIFYRHQAGPLQITPDLQVNVGEGLGGRSWLLLAGVRLGFTF